MIISTYDTFQIEQLHSLHKKYAKTFPVHGKRKEAFNLCFILFHVNLIVHRSTYERVYVLRI